MTKSGDIALFSLQAVNQNGGQTPEKPETSLADLWPTTTEKPVPGKQSPAQSQSETQTRPQNQSQSQNQTQTRPETKPEAGGTGQAAASTQTSGKNLDLAEITKGLNGPQSQAVTYTGGPLLVMAGAGSGKTRVLTRRIAYLLAAKRAWASQILAITFTNKAAAEMRERVAGLIGAEAGKMWVSTFHSACVKILRFEANTIGLNPAFSIYDASDTRRLITNILKEFNIDPKRYAPRTIAAKISDLKNDLLDAGSYAARSHHDPLSELVSRVYLAYESRLKAAGALDFDDLIMQTVFALRAFPQVAQKYQRRFRHILVDEYQDTNPAQYALIRELVGVGQAGGPQDLGPGELTVVGDSDQSIYAFRGATIRNIQEFDRDFPGAHVVYLEQNYRSSANILQAANAVIAPNSGEGKPGGAGEKASSLIRRKRLWTDSGPGAPLVFYAADTSAQEASWVVEEAVRLVNAGRGYNDIAVFYRTNAQSRSFEESLVRLGVPYRIVGGTKFYDRTEVKDAISYLVASVNPDDDIALRRIFNKPKRALGEASEEALAQWARQHNLSFAAACARALGDLGPLAVPLPPPLDSLNGETGEEAGSAESGGIAGDIGGAEEAGSIEAIIEANPGEDLGGADLDKGQYSGEKLQERLDKLMSLPEVPLNPRAQKSLANLWDLLRSLRVLDAQGLPVDEVLDTALENSGLLIQLQTSNDPSDEARVENLGELHNVAQAFSLEEPGARVSDFLQRVALVADSDQIPDESAGQITLMTVHTAKGLEFPVVFVTGLEQGTFPHQRSIDDPSQLEEERRLAYVALTRARQQLYVTYAGQRTLFGQPMDFMPSEFLDDIPRELLEMRREATSRERWRIGGEEDEGQYFSSRSSSLSSRSAAGRPASRGGKRTGKLGVKLTTGAELAGGRISGGAGSGVGGGEEKPGLLLQRGDRIEHKLYGIGTVIGCEQRGRNSTVKVKFERVGVKQLVTAFAPITKL